MPWLVGTALIHSLAVTEKRGAFKAWTVLLAILAFALSLLGTFLVRSGVLTSVHAFATDPKRGIFILGFLTLVIGVSLILYAWRAPRVGVGGAFKLVSREGALLTNNVLSSPCGPHHILCMQGIWEDNINDVNFRIVTNSIEILVAIYILLRDAVLPAPFFPLLRRTRDEA